MKLFMELSFESKDCPYSSSYVQPKKNVMITPV